MNDPLRNDHKYSILCNCYCLICLTDTTSYVLKFFFRIFRIFLQFSGCPKVIVCLLSPDRVYFLPAG